MAIRSLYEMIKSLLMSTTVVVRKKIRKCEAENTDFILLHEIFSKTLKPNMHFRAFRAYYYSLSLDYIDASFIYIDGELSGFISAAFYKTTLNGKPAVIGRAAMGLLPGARGGKLQVWTLYMKYMQYRFFNPFKKVILTLYVANPLVYSLICRYTKTVYPKKDINVAPAIEDFKNELLKQNNLQEKPGSPFVIKIHFQVNLGRDILERVFSSENIYVKYYLAINPWFRDQYGVLVIIPVTHGNVFNSIIRLTGRTLLKTFNKFKNSFLGGLKTGSSGAG